MNIEYRMIVLHVLLLSGGGLAMKLITMNCEVLAFFSLIPFATMSYFLHAKWYEEK